MTHGKVKHNSKKKHLKKSRFSKQSKKWLGGMDGPNKRQKTGPAGAEELEQVRYFSEWVSQLIEHNKTKTNGQIIAEILVIALLAGIPGRVIYNAVSSSSFADYLSARSWDIALIFMDGILTGGQIVSSLVSTLTSSVTSVINFGIRTAVILRGFIPCSNPSIVSCVVFGYLGYRNVERDSREIATIAADAAEVAHDATNVALGTAAEGVNALVTEIDRAPIQAVSLMPEGLRNAVINTLGNTQFIANAVVVPTTAIVADVGKITARAALDTTLSTIEQLTAILYLADRAGGALIAFLQQLPDVTEAFLDNVVNTYSTNIALGGVPYDDSQSSVSSVSSVATTVRSSIDSIRITASNSITSAPSQLLRSSSAQMIEPRFEPMRSQSVASIATSVASIAPSVASRAQSVASSRAQSVAASLRSVESIRSTHTALSNAVGSINDITARITPIVRSNSMDAAPAAPAVDLLTVILENTTAARDELAQYIATPTIVLADEGGAEIIINSGLVALEALAGAAQQSEGVVNILIAQAQVLPNEPLTQHDEDLIGGKPRKTSKKQAYKSKRHKKQTFKKRMHKK
jgi:hypothetical protein